MHKQLLFSTWHASYKKQWIVYCCRNGYKFADTEIWQVMHPGNIGHLVKQAFAESFLRHSLLLLFGRHIRPRQECRDPPHKRFLVVRVFDICENRFPCRALLRCCLQLREREEGRFVLGLCVCACMRRLQCLAKTLSESEKEPYGNLIQIRATLCQNLIKI